MPVMRRRRREFDPVRFVRTTEGQLVIGFFVLLYGVGGGLIWFFYGWGGAVAGWLCMTGAVLFFVLLYGLVSFAGWWANR